MLQMTKRKSGGSRMRRHLVGLARYQQTECCSLTSLHAAPPNFISDIFYLTLAVNHIGQMKLVNNVEDLNRQYDDIRRHLDVLQSDQSWRGVRLPTIYLQMVETLKFGCQTPFQARTEAAINAGKVGSVHRRLFILVADSTVGRARQGLCRSTGVRDTVGRSRACVPVN